MNDSRSNLSLGGRLGARGSSQMFFVELLSIEGFRPVIRPPFDRSIPVTHRRPNPPQGYFLA